MTSNKILISGIPNIARREILFQSAVYWAEEGNKILYITKSKFESLPSTGHGPQIPSPEILAKIRIVYLENAEKLLEFVTDILTLRDTIPRVILVEGLDEMTSTENTRDSGHSLSRACAVLSHVAACCATLCDQVVHLMVTVATTPARLPLAVCSMFNSLWSYDIDSGTLTRKLPFDTSPTVVLTLASRTDGAFVLRHVKQLFGNSVR